MALEIVLSGGIFKAKSILLREILDREVKKEVPRANFIEARYEPVVGAALIALEKKGIKLDQKIRSYIEFSARKRTLIRI